MKRSDLPNGCDGVRGDIYTEELFERNKEKNLFIIKNARQEKTKQRDPPTSGFNQEGYFCQTPELALGVGGAVMSTDGAVLEGHGGRVEGVWGREGRVRRVRGELVVRGEGGVHGVGGQRRKGGDGGVG